MLDSVRRYLSNLRFAQSLAYLEQFYRERCEKLEAELEAAELRYQLLREQMDLQEQAAELEDEPLLFIDTEYDREEVQAALYVHRLEGEAGLRTDRERKIIALWKEGYC